MEQLHWLGFWIFMSVFLVCDTWLYSKGHDTFFHTHKTVAEKAIRDGQAQNSTEQKP